MATLKTSRLPFALLALFVLVLAMASALMAETVISQNKPDARPNVSFAGCRALVLKSDLAWNAWDSTMYGALQRKGKAYKDPSAFTEADASLMSLWDQYMESGTQALCAKLRAICFKRGMPLGCAVNGMINSTACMTNASKESSACKDGDVGLKRLWRLASGVMSCTTRQANDNVFDFLVGMIYEVPAYTARGPLSIMGEQKFIDLLWGLNRTPASMEAEVEEAIRSGSPAVGFWLQFFGKDNSTGNWGLYTGRGGSKKKYDNWFVEPGGLDAASRAFGRVEETWLSYYKDKLLAGDGRFAVQSGVLEPEELTLTIRNCGERVAQRLQGPVDLALLQQYLIHQKPI